MVVDCEWIDWQEETMMIVAEGYGRISDVPVADDVASSGIRADYKV
jgi:hypothetical protein